MTYCPPNCPRRSTHCHSHCQQYLRTHILHTLTDKRAAHKDADERAFHAEESARVKNRKCSRKYGEKKER